MLYNKKFDELMEKQKKSKIIWNKKNVEREEAVNEIKYILNQKEKEIEEAIGDTYINEIENRINHKLNLDSSDFNAFKICSIAKTISTKYYNYIMSNKTKEGTKVKFKKQINMLEQMEHGTECDVEGCFSTKDEFYFLRSHLIDKYLCYGQYPVIGRNNLAVVLNDIEYYLFVEIMGKWERVVLTHQNICTHEDRRRILLCRGKKEADAIKRCKSWIETNINEILAIFKLDTNLPAKLMTSIYMDFFINDVFSDAQLWNWYYEDANIKYRFREALTEDDRTELKERINALKGFEAYRVLDVKLPEEKMTTLFKYTCETNKIIWFVSTVCQKLEIPMATQYLNGVYINEYNNDVYTWIDNIFYRKEMRGFPAHAITGILKEVIYIILNNRQLEKKDSINISNKEKGLIAYKNEIMVERLLEIDQDKGPVDACVVRHLFSPTFQVKRRQNTDLKNLVQMGTCKNQKFGELVKHSVYLQSGTSFFEQYMIEMNTGVMTAWELYNVLFTLRNDEVAKNNKIFEDFAKEISSIRNLNVRCWVLEIATNIISRILNDYDSDVYSELEYLLCAIKDFTKAFNINYDSVYQLLLIYCTDCDVRLLLPYLNMPEESFSRLQRHVWKLEKCKSTNLIIQEKFDVLKEANAKSNYYQCFNRIWRSVIKGQKSIEEQTT